MRLRLMVIGVALILVAVATAVFFGLKHEQGLVTESSLEPQLVSLPNAQQDQRLLQIGVTWLEDGYCYGQFHVTAVESATDVRVGAVVSRIYSDRACAGIGTTNHIAWADLILKAPIANRVVMRASDRMVLPAILPAGILVRKAPLSADIALFGGMNDNPPLGLKKSTHVTNPTQLAQLVQELNSLPPYPSDVRFCPLDDGSYYTVDFHYAAGGDLSIRISALGCQPVFLGQSKQPVAWAIDRSGAPSVFALLDGLLHL